MEPNQLNVTITKEDLKALHHYLFVHYRLKRIIPVYVFLGLLATTILSFQNGFNWHKFFFYGQEIGGLLFIILLFVSLAQYFYLRNRALSNSEFLGKRTIAIDSDGISEKSEADKVRQQWDSVKKVKKTGDAIYVIMGKTAVIVIPKHDFTKLRDFHSTFEKIKALKRAKEA